MSYSRPNGHSSFCCSALDIQRESGSRPNGYFLFVVQLGHAEWPSLLGCSMFDVQRGLIGSADRPFCRSVFDIQRESGSRPNGHFFICSMLMYSD